MMMMILVGFCCPVNVCLQRFGNVTHTWHERKDLQIRQATRIQLKQHDVLGTSMPVFIVIATKFQKLPFSVLEVCMSGDKMCRIQKADDVVDAILTVQKAVIIS